MLLNEHDPVFSISLCAACMLYLDLLDFVLLRPLRPLCICAPTAHRICFSRLRTLSIFITGSNLGAIEEHPIIFEETSSKAAVGSKKEECVCQRPISIFCDVHKYNHYLFKGLSFYTNYWCLNDLIIDTERLHNEITGPSSLGFFCCLEKTLFSFSYQKKSSCRVKGTECIRRMKRGNR